MKLPNSEKQRAKDLMVREGFYALKDVNGVSQETWDSVFDLYVNDAALFKALESLRPAENSVKIELFRRRPGWTREEERGITRHAIDLDLDRESSPPRRENSLSLD
jgi:hypothetical protein